ncbi:sulfatase family protein [Homoserinibacter sp. YIM 151385]|uniref:sulfatase family protein n=1 Tax=Homoserinibacter sp. YIM 151385 TaxID=2985506 RepID=UPI0022EFE728|nr:sulfatase [Homoserinibacter sp. YIM 151385]WBU37534.1 sulfatase [Homoserinibacter sp. YIM 151385]
MTAARRPNIVLILTDDHAAHAIGAYGSVVNRTPRIDEIAAEGRVLENCFCTNSLCAPSRASILTGAYSHVNGVTTLGAHIDASQPTFVSALRESGYRTAIVGKWHLGDGAPHDPQGFDYWDVLVEQGEYFDPTFLSAEGRRTVPGYATDVITDLALEWAEQQEGDAPWCLLIWHKAPHRPWEPDEAHKGMYSDPIPVPATFGDDYATRTSAAHRATMRVADDLTLEDLKEYPPPGLTYEETALWKYQRYMEDYLACVASVDDNVGRVLDWLRGRELFDDTLVMYSSDQGFYLGDHGWYDKRLMYDEALRMPLLVSYPRQIPADGTRLGQIVTNVDFAQTILEAAGVAAPERMQGVSIWPQLTSDPERPTRDAMYYRYYEHGDSNHGVFSHYGVRTERHKLIYFTADGEGQPWTSNLVFTPDWELYDLVEDPDELRNVVHDPAYAEVRDELIDLLARVQREAGDTPHPSQALMDPRT